MKCTPSSEPVSKTETMSGWVILAADEAVVVGVLRCEDLHRDGPAEHRVGAEEDLGHAAATELALDAVAAPEGHR